MKLALIKNNVVKNIVDATEEEFSGYASVYELIIDVTNTVPQPQVGWFLDGNKLVSNGSNGPIRITKLAMRQRFTFTDLCALESAAQTIVQVKVLIGNLNVASFVDLTRSDTISGLGLLVSLGLLTSQRMSEILNTPPTEYEIYKGE